MPTLNPIVHTLLIGLVSSALTVSAYAQQGTAVDVLATDIASFINALPRDAVSDRPIRVVDVGDYRVGVYGVFRPKDFLGGANLHRVETTEIYYIIKGTGHASHRRTAFGSRRVPNKSNKSSRIWS